MLKTMIHALHPRYLSKFSSPLSTCRFAAKKISDFSMEKVKHPEERVGKEACESNTTKMKRLSDDIMPHLLNLYGSRATSQDFEIYHVNASFEDPLMCAHGVQNSGSPIVLQQIEISNSSYNHDFSTSNVFSESRIVEYSVTEKVISAGKQEILIDNKQQYKFLGRNIDMISLIRLDIEDGKVVRHEDWWDKKPLRNRETVKLPCVGRLMELTRRGSMLATHALMGFGKDQTGLYHIQE